MPRLRKFCQVGAQAESKPRRHYDDSSFAARATLLEMLLSCDGLLHLVSVHRPTRAHAACLNQGMIVICFINWHISPRCWVRLSSAQSIAFQEECSSDKSSTPGAVMIRDWAEVGEQRADVTGTVSSPGSRMSSRC